MRKSFHLHLQGGRQLSVLDGLSFSVQAGECVALLGASGRGKSSLLRCLYGSYGTDRGRIWFRSETEGRIDLAAATAQQVLRLRRREIAHVSQFLRVVPRVSALDVVAERVVGADLELPLDANDALWSRAQDGARSAAAEVLLRLQVPRSLWDLPPATFSGGEQQRVNIARALVRVPQLLLLDEPTASLDRRNRQVVVQMVREAKADGAAVVGIFHDEAVRDAIADRGVSLD